MDERFVAAYDYALPPELIAQTPAARRDAARLLVVHENGDVDDRIVADLPTLLRAGDLLVLNETRVIAARLRARRGTGGAVEILLLHPAAGLRYDPRATEWTALVRPARRVRLGDALEIVDGEGAPCARATVAGAHAGGARTLRFEGLQSTDELLARAGRLALPPYIRTDSDEAQARYQTVFARVPGSVAAPTAALHLTAEVLAALGARGIEIARLSLDVGMGTFRPMTAERVEEHLMHAEHYTIPPETAAAVGRAKAAHRRVVAVGTTVVRALEGNALEHGGVRAGEFETQLFITPGFRFRVVDALVTNFHLPKSSLLVLVSAFSGRERVLAAYRTAVERRYRFFSFGDAMLLARTSAR